MWMWKMNLNGNLNLKGFNLLMKETLSIKRIADIIC